MPARRGERTPYRDACWPTVRLYVLHRDGWRCQLQGPGCTGQANAADHIQPWRENGAWFDPTNLRASCTHCNSARANLRRQGRDLETNTPSRNW